MNTATFICDLTDFRSDARLYRLDPPISMERNWDEDTKGRTAEYVVVSAVVATDTGRAETYIFAATAEGEVTDWGELDGSFRGRCNHAEALSGAGYEVVPALTRAEEARP